MKIFSSRECFLVLTDLQKLLCDCNDGKKDAAIHGGPSQPEDTELKVILASLEEAEDMCQKVGWRHAERKIADINSHLRYHKGTEDYSSLAANLRNTVDVIEAALLEHQFVAIDPAFTDFINKEMPFGPEVCAAFPEAIADLSEAGNCIAVGLGTAAVFHLMRAVEWGLRGLCEDLGVTRVRRSRKPGKQKYVASDWAQWERLLGEVQKRVDEKVDNLGPGKKKQEIQQFYSGLYT